MTRFAIYYMPHQSSQLARFGASILGYDAESGTDVAYPEEPIFLEPAALGWTAAPRRYGFHATLQAPFRLNRERSVDDLAAGLEAFAAGRDSFGVDLKLGTSQDGFALLAVEPSTALARLADDCVRDFDGFRAPLTASDRERRRPDRLSPALLENLDRWGYPHVLDHFHFHMTLTGPLPLDDRLRLGPVLQTLFALVPPRAVIDALVLLRQDDEQGRFRVERRFPFRRD